MEDGISSEMPESREKPVQKYCPPRGVVFRVLFSYQETKPDGTRSALKD